MGTHFRAASALFTALFALLTPSFAVAQSEAEVTTALRDVDSMFNFRREMKSLEFSRFLAPQLSESSDEVIKCAITCSKHPSLVLKLGRDELPDVFNDNLFAEVANVGNPGRPLRSSDKASGQYTFP